MGLTLADMQSDDSADPSPIARLEFRHSEVKSHTHQQHDEDYRIWTTTVVGGFIGTNNGLVPAGPVNQMCHKNQMEKITHAPAEARRTGFRFLRSVSLSVPLRFLKIVNPSSDPETIPITIQRMVKTLMVRTP